MKTRILSGLIMLPFLVILVFGGWVLKIACILVGVIALWEFYHAFHQMDAKPSIIIGILSIAILYGINFLKLDTDFYLLWLFLSIIMSFLYLFDMKKHKLTDGIVTLTGIVYVVFFSFHIALIDDLKGYEIFIWMVIITAFVTDIMAYFTGYFFGKTKLCPSISPKKTVEGALGGTLGAVIASGIFGLIFTEGLFVHCLVLGFIASIASQFGDLTASIFKRNLGIKDYGNLIPGHGGILDRFDSVLFTAPVIYYYLSLVVIR